MHTWVEISLSALRRNLQAVRRRLAPGAEVCAVVKADAYGHGAVACARLFASEGVRWFAVTSLDEGARLRQAGLPARVLVLAGFTAAEAAGLVELDLTPAVWDPAQIDWLAAACRRRSEPFPIHLKFDTGMGRLGATAAQEAALFAALERAPALRVEAVFSHLSAAEADDPATSHTQWSAFQQSGLRWAHRLEAGLPRHLVNSAGLQRFPQWSGAMARVGLALYGYGATPEAARELTPALSWKAQIAALKTLPAGHGVGYGGLFRTPEPLPVATISAGYADGYRRDFSPGADVLLAGACAPVLGAVSMDLTTVDARHAGPLALGDEVTLLGGHGDAVVTALDLARVAGTIPYEVLCGISARVTRHYRD